MERKLIRQGGGGYTIYLPKKWVEENKLDKGDELSINISGKDLVLSAKPSHIKIENEITLPSSHETTINTLITISYRTGYDRIKINFINEKQYDLIKEIIKSKLIGFEITKKEKDYCIAESITEPSSDNFDNILKKMFMNIEDLFIITKNRLLNNSSKTDNYKEVEELIKKYYYFCIRVIMKQKLIKKNSEFFTSFLLKISNAEREIYYLDKYLDYSKKRRYSNELMELFETSFKMFKLLTEAFNEKDLEKITKIQELEKEAIYKKSYKILEKNHEGIEAHHITSCIRNLHISTGSLMALIV